MTKINRTRFLPALDRLIAQDRRGAIADMLQVLREQGVVQTAVSASGFDVRHIADAGAKDAIKRDLSSSLGHLATEHVDLVRSDRHADPRLVEMSLSIDVVRSDKI